MLEQRGAANRGLRPLKRTLRRSMQALVDVFVTSAR